MIGGIVAVVGLVVILRFVVGLGVAAVHRAGAVTGDAEVGSALERARDWRSRRLAAAVVEPRRDNPIRVATVDCSTDDVFELGSISKAITGMLLADAEQRGELSMSDQIGDHVPELADRPIGAVTVSALASHRSGLPPIALGIRAVPGLLGYGVLGLSPYVGQGVSSVVSHARRVRLRTQGEQAYSSLGAALTGAVLERATGSTYEDLVRDRLATPLGLTHTSAGPNAPRRSGCTRWGRWAQQWRLTGYAPAGGVTSSIDDLAVLAAALLRGDAPGAASTHRDDCFWVRERMPGGGIVVWHNGQTGGYAAYLVIRPDLGKATVVLSDVADMGLVVRVAQAAATSD